VKFAAFTGKAAKVMRDKGCDGATTIDSLIYKPLIETSCAAKGPCAPPHCKNRCQNLRKRHIGRTLNEDSDAAEADLIIIDEVSMVGEQMGQAILSFDVPVLVLGDIFQLPPIHGEGFFTRGRPEFELTEIHRQAAGSPVIQLATQARLMEPLQRGIYGSSSVVGVDQVSIAQALAYDQIICGTHKLRHRVTAAMRAKLGYTGPTPQPGEKVICLKNDHRAGLLNGSMWIVREAIPLGDGFIRMTVEDESGDIVEVITPELGFAAHDGKVQDLSGQPFAFGYVITCHKAQGSQWDSILVLDESHVFRQDRHRWLYTAITRATERVTVRSKQF
jgi:exodeoxyribonuclease-5